MNMCWLYHKWGKWEKKQGGAILVDKLSVGEYMIQERVCSRCNKVQYSLTQAQVVIQ